MNEMNQSKQVFDRALGTFARSWRWGLAGAAVMLMLTLGGLVLLTLGWFDYLAPLSDEARRYAARGLAGIGAVIVLRALVPVLRFGTREAAEAADAPHSTRKPVTTALELAQESAISEASPMRQYLVDRALAEGALAVEVARFPMTLPWPQVKRHGWLLATVLAVGLALFISNSRAVTTIVQRLLRPEADIPPYSHLSFEVSPASPHVVYGADAELEVTISGGPVGESVVLLQRVDKDSPVSSAGAFAMGAGRYGQRLQQVVQPMEFAFAAGAARSAWHRVEVQRQPRVEAVRLKVTPPAYARLPVKEFTLGTAELVALPGSEVEARVTSNRPLSGGLITITPTRSASREKPETIQTSTTAAKEVVLRWKVRSPALVRLDLKDVTGALSASPVELEQKVMPDEPPEVMLSSPAGLTLATPESEVPLAVEVEDDLGIARVDLVRKLVGYRDRGRVLTEDAEERSYALSEKLTMARLGAVPGQTMEWYAQAQDHNPSLMGIGSSRVGRIQVISTEEYAELVRARTTMQEFRERFAALDRALEAVRKSLEKAATDGDPQSVQEAREAMKKAEDLARQMSKDFVAFDAEKQVAEEAERIAQQMQQMSERLDRAGTQGTKAEAQQQLAEIGESRKRTGELKQQGTQLAQVGRVLEMAAEFKAMHAAQRDLTKHLEELAREVMNGDLRNAAKLDGLTKRQQSNLDRWKKWLPELRAAAEDLPDEYAKLKKEALDFARAADESRIERDMQRAIERAKADNTPDTFVNSQLALVGMDMLTNGQSGFCQACRDGQLHFDVRPDLASTMKQMLQAMCRRRGGQGQKPGQEGNGTGGGGTDDGYSMEGDPMMAAPVFGPGRMAFNGEGSMRGETQGQGKGQGTKTIVKSDATTQIDATPTRTSSRRQISLRDVPERYRDAVRRFYGEDAVIETSTPAKP